MKRYSSVRSPVPPEHVLVFDEAQRAFDREKMRETHGATDARSEPEEFIAFADRIPEWSVVVGLIGSGQEIHVGEEAGLAQWRIAVEGSARCSDWTIHAPPAVAGLFRSGTVAFELNHALNLDTALRFHQAKDLHRYVAQLLDGVESAQLAPIAHRLNTDGLHLRITRSLDVAKRYLRHRYGEDRSARFGVIASSKDRDLAAFGIPNDFQSTKRVKMGPWYGDHESDDGGHSCRRLETCVTEFGAQGLELDAALLAWGTDFIRVDGQWSNAFAGGYRKRALVRDAFQLRLNAYRVLLTRGRDATVVFVPPLARLDETYQHLRDSGMLELTD